MRRHDRPRVPGTVYVVAKLASGTRELPGEFHFEGVPSLGPTFRSQILRSIALGNPSGSGSRSHSPLDFRRGHGSLHGCSLAASTSETVVSCSKEESNSTRPARSGRCVRSSSPLRRVEPVLRNARADDVRHDASAPKEWSHVKNLSGNPRTSAATETIGNRGTSAVTTERRSATCVRNALRSCRWGATGDIDSRRAVTRAQRAMDHDEIRRDPRTRDRVVFTADLTSTDYAGAGIRDSDLNGTETRCPSSTWASANCNRLKRELRCFVSVSLSCDGTRDHSIERER